MAFHWGDGDFTYSLLHLVIVLYYYHEISNIIYVKRECVTSDAGLKRTQSMGL